MLLLPAPFVITPSRTAPKRITIRDGGGVYSQVYGEAFYQPFTQATGIEVVNVASEPEPTAQIRMMVQAKRYLWDMAIISDRAVQFLTTGHVYLEQHELEQDPVISAIMPSFLSPYGVGSNLYTTVLAYRTDAFKGRRAPQSWQDLWDVAHFPGRRSLRKHPFDTLEIALMADGVPPANVYPCDLPRAFRSLDTIKPHMTNWWTSGPQTEQLLTSGEVELMPAWNGRAQAAINAHAPVGIAWGQHLYKCGSWAILKGTPHADGCRQFIRFASDPKQQALLATIGVGPVQPEAFKYIDPKQAPSLPSYPALLKKGLHTDPVYWTQHQQAVIERFNEWLMS